jgi:hypothetical protein
MEIKGKVHCFFEQSGTFKNEFIKLGIPAEDYDIQNNFGHTDHVVDLFENIQNAYEGGASVFDNITEDDLIVAFFPCIYFSCLSAVWYSLTQRDYKTWTTKKIIENVIDRNRKRSEYFEILNKFCGIVLDKGLRMVFENPYSMNHFLKFGFLKPPSIIDEDRTRRGDFFIKPTGFWFWNCEPTYGESFQEQKKRKSVLWSKKAKEKGLCSEERSMISPDYARNFICDFILGKKQEIGQLSLF